MRGKLFLKKKCYSTIESHPLEYKKSSENDGSKELRRKNIFKIYCYFVISRE